MRKTVWIGLSVVIIVFVVVAWQANRLMPIGVGYVAKTMCSEHFVSGRTDTDHIWSDIIRISSTFKFVAFEIQEAAQHVEAKALLGLFRVITVHRPGLGCTIAIGVDPISLRPLPRSTWLSVAGICAA